ncbi:MAG: flippase [Fusobacteriaceae bacterium]
MASVSKNYIYNIISLATGILFPVFTFPYISRILMFENLGKIWFVQSINNYFLILALLGIPAYATRELSRAKVLNDGKKEFKKVFNELLIIGIIGSIISFILLNIVIRISPQLYSLKKLSIIFSFQIIFAFLEIDYIFIVLENHKRRTIRTIILRVISIFFMFIFVKKPSDYIIYGMILVFPDLIARVIDLYSCKSYLSLNLKNMNLKRHIKPLFTIFLYVFSIGIYLNLDSSMLGFLSTLSEVGLYASATKMTRIAIPILGALGTVIAPRIIGAIKKKDIQSVYKYIDLFINFNVFIGIPGVILLFLLSDSFIFMFSGKGYESAVLTMKIMTPIVFFIPLGAFFGAKVLLPNDQEKMVFKVAISGTIANVILNFMLIPSYGKNGAAFATVVTEILIFFYRLYEVKKIYPDYEFITKRRINYVLASIIPTVIVCFLIEYNWMNFGYKILGISGIFGIVYFLILYFLKDEFIDEGIKIIKKKFRGHTC